MSGSPAHPSLDLADPPGVDREIAPDDFMYEATSADAYFRGGSTALRAIRLALLAADRPAPRRILDLPSGHGRVMRYLRAAWPEAELVACDILDGGIRWCADRFAATPVRSVADPAAVELPGRFDVAWCGSLLTHLPAHRWLGWFESFERHVEPGGLLVFSVHGRFVEARMKDGATYSLAPDDLVAVLAATAASGFGYADYPDQEGYGVSLSRADWVVRELLARGRWQLESYAERALNLHQDVVVARRT